jgi:hypothetical protein
MGLLYGRAGRLTALFGDFRPGQKGGIRTLAELQDVYHGTVGHNSFLMMDFAPTPEGLIAPDQAARYKEFGDWMRGCYYGSGVAGKVEHALGSPEAGAAQLVRFAAPRSIDRVVLREDQTDGQARGTHRIIYGRLYVIYGDYYRDL